MEFRTGDRVQMIVDYPPGVYKGESGTVIKFDYLDRIIIRWDERSQHKHDSDGEVEDGHGWFVYEEQIELIPAIDLGDFSKDVEMDSIMQLLGG